MDRRDEIWPDSALTRRLESRAAASMAAPKLDAADFEGSMKLIVLEKFKDDVPCTAGYRQPIETTNESARIKF